MENLGSGRIATITGGDRASREAKVLAVFTGYRRVMLFETDDALFTSKGYPGAELSPAQPSLALKIKSPTVAVALGKPK